MGLGIAVTCIIAHAFLSSASKKQVGDLEGFALKLENLLAESAQGAEGLRATGNGHERRL